MRLTSLSLIALTFALSACGTKQNAKPQPLVQSVTVAQVAPHDIAGAITASGRLLPREEIAVAADLNGYRVSQVLVEEGAQVHRGQVLATLDSSLLQSQIDQVHAGLAQQEIAAQQSRDQAARVNGLDNQGVISSEAIESRRMAARTSVAAVAATRAQLNDLMVRKAHLAIRAPSDGIILERSARPGDTSSVGATMFRLARGGLIELFAELPEANVAGLSVGDPVEVQLASGKTLQGHVRLVGERVDNQTGLVTVRVALPPSNDLRQGGFAQARFTRVASALAVPEAAVFYDADGASVKTVDSTNHIHSTRVRTGRHAQGLVEILQGPPANSTVAVKGGAFTLDGDTVQIVKDAAK